MEPLESIGAGPVTKQAGRAAFPARPWGPTLSWLLIRGGGEEWVGALLLPCAGEDDRDDTGEVDGGGPAGWAK